MATFFEDPRLRQRWNQISHNAEAVTENAAAGIWTFQHTYVTPCLSSLGEGFDTCTSVCLGDREERARRQRERARGAHRTTRAEYSFDFYDDWYDDFDADDEGGLVDGGTDDERAGGFGSLFGRGFWGSWRGNRAEDWDRLLAGSGSARSSRRGGEEGGGASELDDPASVGATGEIAEQPRRRRGMSYTTRAIRRKVPDIRDDPTVIPSTAPLGFLSRLPFKFGGTLRYKPSSANLREHPAAGTGRSRDQMAFHAEREPLLGGVGSDDNDDDDYHHGQHETGGGSSLHPSRYGGACEDRTFSADDDVQLQYGSMNEPTMKGTGATSSDLADANMASRKRSSTIGSGDTSDSFRSRGDLFPSDEEDDEDAVPLDDEFAVALDRVGDDRSSGRTRFSSSSSLAAVGASSGGGGSGGGGGGGGGQRKGKKRADSVMASSLHSSQASLKKRHSARSLALVGAVAEAEAAAEAEIVGGSAAIDADTSYDADTSMEADAFLDPRPKDHDKPIDLDIKLLPPPPPPHLKEQPLDSAPEAEVPAAVMAARELANIEAGLPETTGLAHPTGTTSQEVEFVPAMLPRFR